VIAPTGDHVARTSIEQNPYFQQSGKGRVPSDAPTMAAAGHVGGLFPPPSNCMGFNGDVGSLNPTQIQQLMMDANRSVMTSNYLQFVRREAAAAAARLRGNI
jgi:hypothetical protein